MTNPNYKWTPEKLSELTGSCWHTCAIQAAVKLDIFSIIASGSNKLEDITSKLESSERGVRILLDAMAALNLLEKEKDNYFNSSFAKKHLTKDSADYIGYRLLHHHYLLESWQQLDKAVKTGSPVGGKDIFTQEENRREAFLMSMYTNAMRVAPLVANQINLKGKTKLIDMGGGPGTYAIHFCKKNPKLIANVYDLATTKPYALKTISKFNLSERIGFVDGNYFTDDVPSGYDVAWLSHIMHSASPRECNVIIKKAITALNPGGIVLIHDFFLDPTMTTPFFPAIFSLNMLARTKEGQSYSENQISEMMTDNGLINVKRLNLKLPNDSDVIMGVRG